MGRRKLKSKSTKTILPANHSLIVFSICLFRFFLAIHSLIVFSICLFRFFRPARSKIYLRQISDKSTYWDKKNKKVFNYHISILLHIYIKVFNIHVRIDCKERSMDISATEFLVHLWRSQFFCSPSLIFSCCRCADKRYENLTASLNF